MFKILECASLAGVVLAPTQTIEAVLPEARERSKPAERENDGEV